MKLGLETEVLNIQTMPTLPTLQCQYIFKTGGSRNARVHFANWVAKVATGNSQFLNCQLWVSKLSTGQSLLYFPPGASETANLTNFTNFAKSVAKVATGNSQFLNCQLKFLRKSTLVNSAPKYSLQSRSSCLGKAPLCIYLRKSTLVRSALS
jgi:hypothetical protein